MLGFSPLPCLSIALLQFPLPCSHFLKSNGWVYGITGLLACDMNITLFFSNADPLIAHPTQRTERSTLEMGASSFVQRTKLKDEARLHRGDSHTAHSPQPPGPLTGLCITWGTLHAGGEPITSRVLADSSDHSIRVAGRRVSLQSQQVWEESPRALAANGALPEWKLPPPIQWVVWAVVGRGECDCPHLQWWASSFIQRTKPQFLVHIIHF